MKKRNNLKEFQKLLPQEVDAALITSDVNRRYLTGFPSTAGTLVVTRRSCTLLIDSRYYEAAEAALQGCEVVLLESLQKQLKALLSRRKVKRLGLESRSATVRDLRRYGEWLPGVEIDTGDGVSDAVVSLRARKEPWELAHMRAAQAVADRAFAHILGFLQTGRTEREIAVELELFCRREGSDEPAFASIVAAGPNSSLPHAVPGDRALQLGDFITMDFGCTVEGYRSDMTRTVALGSVSPRQRELYETVLDAQLAALKAVRAGAACRAVDKVARDIIDASEFRGLFGHGLGHCVGLEVHEDPRLSPLSDAALESGMVTSVEPGIYSPGEYGVRIEDTVVVTGDGCENLCASPKELIIL